MSERTVTVKPSKPTKEKEEKTIEEQTLSMDETKTATSGKKEESGKVKSITELPGIGPQTAEKLLQAGYKTLESIAVASPMELMEAAGIGEITAGKAIGAARESLEMGYETADKILARRETLERISTGSKELDSLIGGGVETQSITEVYGQYASGKTQWAFQLCVMTQLPTEQGGLSGNILYIDSENSFRPERVVSIAKAKGLDPEKTLKNIFVARAYNADHQMLLAEKAVEMIAPKNIKLIIVDSLTSLFRSEFIGRGQLSDRQQRLNRHMHTLQKVAEMHNVAVLVTNQVMSRPDVLFGDPTSPIGGHIVGHNSKTRIYLRKAKENKRVAKLVDSPSLPDGEAIYSLTDAGIEDA
ncbi:MAG: DNA repair and recombination protein RadA [Candidatus Diapherotrites archaeon]|uniref:DNA repair and recombination protein RadA n=1 Tax=Candidatus Iainarchaeum sp. TaxID=3101447 RepID=A0A8T4L943_9ARCH|nr:DNA repair and recombination protein RadA [Candidatus Diapherotrites archaeon]